MYCAGIVRNRKARHPVRPISAFPVVTLLRYRASSARQWHLVAKFGKDEVDICPRLILKAVGRVSEMSALCLNCVILNRLPPLNQRHAKVTRRIRTLFYFYSRVGYATACIVHSSTYIVQYRI